MYKEKEGRKVSIDDVKEQFMDLVGRKGFSVDDGAFGSYDEDSEGKKVQEVIIGSLGSSEAVIKKLEETFSGVDGFEKLKAGVKTMLESKQPLGEFGGLDSDNKIQHVHTALDNLQKISKIAKLAVPLAQKLDEKFKKSSQVQHSQKSTLINAQVQGYKTIVGQVVRQVAEVLKDPNKEVKPIEEELGKSVSKILSTLERSSFEVKYPKMAFVAKVVARPFNGARSFAVRKGREVARVLSRSKDKGPER